MDDDLKLHWLFKVSDSELEWLENDITELMEKDGPQSNSYHLFNNLKKTLADTRAKAQVIQWNPNKLEQDFIKPLNFRLKAKIEPQRMNLIY